MRSVLLTSVMAIVVAAAALPAEAAGVRMYVRNEVSDYATWRKGYESFSATRKKMGVTGQAVYRSADDPKDVTITHDFKTLALAKALAASDELKAAMEKAGVSGTPQIWFTTMANGSRAEAAGVRMYVRHEVSDYATWRKAYDDFQPTAKKMGVMSQAVYQSADNPYDVTVTSDFKTLEKAKALADSPELKAAMEKAGVSSTPQIWFATRAAK